MALRGQDPELFKGPAAPVPDQLNNALLCPGWTQPKESKKTRKTREREESLTKHRRQDTQSKHKAVCKFLSVQALCTEQHWNLEEAYVRRKKPLKDFIEETAVLIISRRIASSTDLYDHMLSQNAEVV